MQGDLFQKSIHELRIIGRQLGVKSVTTLKKKELIKSIMDIYAGKKPPNFTKHGRKPYVYKNDNYNINKEKLKIIDNILTKAKKEILDLLSD